jgi:hypothetical protein
VKFDPEDRKLLVKVAKDRRETLSDFIRRSAMKELASLGYLPERQHKSLGMQKADQQT